MVLLELEKFILDHDDWEERLAAEPYCIKITRKGSRCIFNYDRLLSDVSLPIVKECRGIILQVRDYDTVDYGDSYLLSQVYKVVKHERVITRLCAPFSSVEEPIQENVDGFLMRVYYDPEATAWIVASDEVMDIRQWTANELYTFSDLFNFAFRNATHNSLEEFAETYLVKGITYMFELVSPHTKVVIPNDETKLYFLGLRDAASLLGDGPAECEELAQYFDYIT